MQLLLKKNKMTKPARYTYSHVLAGLDWLETDKWDLHRQNGSYAVDLQQRTLHGYIVKSMSE